MERREMRQLQTIVEDKIRLDAAVCQEQATIKLGKTPFISRHRSDPLPRAFTPIGLRTFAPLPMWAACPD